MNKLWYAAPLLLLLYMPKKAQAFEPQTFDFIFSTEDDLEAEELLLAIEDHGGIIEKMTLQDHLVFVKVTTTPEWDPIFIADFERL